MSHPFVFRNYCDEIIFKNVAIDNEYGLPDRLDPDDVVIDIGTHAGSFCYAALARGSDRVHGFEAFPDNYRAACRNLAPYAGRITLHNKAVWRSDVRIDALCFNEMDEYNTACGHVLGAAGLRVEAVALDDVLLQVTEGGRRRVRLLKVDCEGSEYPILFTSTRLDLVDEIVGEFHDYTTKHDPSHPFHRIPDHARVEGFRKFTAVEIAQVLGAAGFDVTIEPLEDGQVPAGHFRAVRVAEPSGVMPRTVRDGLAKLFGIEIAPPPAPVPAPADGGPIPASGPVLVPNGPGDLAFYHVGCESPRGKRMLSVAARRVVRRILRPLFVRQVELYRDAFVRIDRCERAIRGLHGAEARQQQLERDVKTALALGWDQQAVVRRLAALEEALAAAGRPPSADDASSIPFPGVEPAPASARARVS